MKQNKLIIAVAIIFILAIVAFMAWDFFGDNKPEKNVYEYNLDNYNEVDTNLIDYTEIQQINPDIEVINCISVDFDDNIYVAGDSVINIYNSAGILINEILTNSDATCITVDQDNNIYLGAKDHVEIWDTNGSRKSTWESFNEKSIITSIAISDSNVFVADAGNKIIYHYNIVGKFINEIGRKDSLSGIQGFVIPSPYFDVAIGRDGEIWAVNSGRHQLEAYKADGSLISSWKKTSMGLNGFSGCCNPSHIALLNDGSFVTSEKGLVRIKIHKPSGEFSSVVAAPDNFEKGTRGLDLAVDSKDRIIVLDPKKGILRIFQHKDN
ncbi:MAG: hypothetical protein HQ521_19285 [Bacteroidetes bacterium]|nr:hypothetical protein [Bacteroidota bacterium]